jgi:hypothetical protein
LPEKAAGSLARPTHSVKDKAQALVDREALRVLRCPRGFVGSGARAWAFRRSRGRRGRVLANRQP